MKAPAIVIAVLIASSASQLAFGPVNAKTSFKVDSKQSEFMAILDRANAQERSDNIVGAIAILSEGLKQNLPERAWLYSTRAHYYGYTSNRAAALADFDSALALAPKNPDIFWTRGLSFRSWKDYSLAIFDFNRAIELDPKTACFFQARAEANLRLNNYGAALDDYNTAISLDPKDGSFYSGRGQLKSDGHPEINKQINPIADFSKAIQLQPDVARNYWLRAIEFANSRNYAQALTDCNRAIKLNPHYGNALAFRAILNCVSGKIGLAQGDAQLAIRSEPTNAFAHYMCGAISSASGDLLNAVKEKRIAVKLCPGLTASGDWMKTVLICCNNDCIDVVMSYLNQSIYRLHFSFSRLGHP